MRRELGLRLIHEHPLIPKSAEVVRSSGKAVKEIGHTEVRHLKFISAAARLRRTGEGGWWDNVSHAIYRLPELPGNLRP